jgi:hypothetical protein
MCFTASTSLLTFIIGIVGSIALIKFGNPKYKSENLVFGIWSIFIALIQLMDFLFWIDLKNKYGINYILTLFGPWINTLQPVIFYLVKYIYFKPTISLENWNINNIYAILNFSYFINFIMIYWNFINESKLTTSTKHGHLNWPWINYSNKIFYIILFALNIFYLTNFNYSLMVFIITYTFLILSYYFFRYNVGEIWCFFGAFIPIILLFGSFYL